MAAYVHPEFAQPITPAELDGLAQSMRKSGEQMLRQEISSFDGRLVGVLEHERAYGNMTLRTITYYIRSHRGSAILLFAVNATLFEQYRAAFEAAARRTESSKPW